MFIYKMTYNSTHLSDLDEQEVVLLELLVLQRNGQNLILLVLLESNTGITPRPGCGGGACRGGGGLGFIACCI
jgi:hypothetical protein